MAGFSLLSVLGNGSGRTASHHRFPVAAYQSGSILVLWDYVRAGGESRKFVLLQPNQRCTSLFFSRDAQFLLGLWLSQVGQPMLTVWQVTDGAKVAEQRLSDQSGGANIWADLHSESSHLLVVHGDPVASASVVCWNDKALRLQPAAHGHLAGTAAAGLRGARLLDEGRHFLTCEASAVVFWAFLERIPRQALRVDLKQPVRDFEVHAGLVYLLSEKGGLQTMNFEGRHEHQQAIGLPAGSACTAVAARGPVVCVGLDDGALHAHSAVSGELWRRVPFPLDNPGVPPPPILSVVLGMNDDYACVSFADATYGVVHLDSGRYIALRIGHSSPVRAFVMAPHLQVPPAVAGGLPDSAGLAHSRAVSFITLAMDPTWVTWPRLGAPARGVLRSVAGPPAAGVAEGRGLELESYAAARQEGRAHEGAPLVLSAAAFHPEARLGKDSSVAGSYRMVAGVADGSLHLLQSEESSSSIGHRSRDVAWRTLRVRPAAADARSVSFQGSPGRLGLRGQQPEASQGSAACCHVAFSRCGQFVAASFQSGFAEMLVFPELSRALVLQGELGSSQPDFPSGLSPFVGREPVHPKAFFVWPPEDPCRTYDKNLYLVSHTATPREVVLYEVYTFGDAWAKLSRTEFPLPAVCQAAGGEITDFCVHPSQRFLVVAAVLPAADTRSIALVFDLWGGELLSSCALFGSLLTAPLLPLRPSLCIDASGAFIFCTSTPTSIRPLSTWGQCEEGAEAQGIFTDSMLAKSLGARSLTEARSTEQTASLVCIIDFHTGQQTYQSTVEVSCLATGSLAQDPTQLFLGAHDGTVSVWHPPDTVSSRIKELLSNSEAVSRLGSNRQPFEARGLLTPTELEVAVAAYWSIDAQQPNWDSWGEEAQSPKARRSPPDAALPPSPQMELLPRPDHEDVARPAKHADGDDVVVQARRRWPPPAPAPAAAGAAHALGAEPQGWCPRPVVREAMRTWPPLESLMPGMLGSAPRADSAGWPPAGRLAQGPTRAATAAAQTRAPDVQRVALPAPRALRMERDEVSGLEVAELCGSSEDPSLPGAARPPAGLEGGRGVLPSRALEPAELLVSAPELYEEFGTSHEHFGEPPPTPRAQAQARVVQRPQSGLGANLRAGAVGGGLRAARHLSVLKSVLSEIDRFETENPESRALESPRSDVDGDEPDAFGVDVHAADLVQA